MEEKTIYQVSLAMIIIGLIILLLCADQIEVKSIEQIDEIKASEAIKISGTITKVSNIGKATIIEIEGQTTTKVPAIVFEDEDIFLSPGDSVEIVGTTEEYNGEKEIIATKVTKR